MKNFLKNICIKEKNLHDVYKTNLFKEYAISIAKLSCMGDVTFSSSDRSDIVKINPF